MFSNEILESLQKNIKLNISLSGLAEDFIEKKLDGVLQKIVDDTSNPLDNILKASIMPLLQAQIIEELQEIEAKNPMNLSDILEQFKKEEE